MRKLPHSFHALGAALCAVLSLMIATSAGAQDPGKGAAKGAGTAPTPVRVAQAPPALVELTPEQARRIWALQAQSVAARLTLGADEAKAMTDAYVASRTHLDEASKAAREPGASQDNRAASRAQASERNEAERVRLQEALAAAKLTPEQVQGAILPLGSFERAWDRLVGTLVRLELDDKTMSQALGYVETYVVAAQTAQQSRASGSTDRATAREATKAAREKLTADLTAVLDEEQMTELTRAMEPARARGAGRSADRSAARSERLHQLDTNGNGTIEREEMPEGLRDRFDSLDTNHDGKLDEQELLGGLPPAGGRGGGAGGAGGAKPEGEGGTGSGSGEEKPGAGGTKP